MSDFAGQWMGISVGDPDGLLVCDLEDVHGEVRGKVSLFPHDLSIPASSANIAFIAQNPVSVDAPRVLHFIGNTGYVPSWQELGYFFPEVTLPSSVEAVLRMQQNGELQVDWKTPAETGGKAALRRVKPGKRSSIMPERHIDNWGEFQNFAKKSVGKGFAFRGQSKSWPLATTFHRKGRTNLDRYWSSDIPRLQRATSSSLTHVFDLMKQFELNAFLNLAQHHGYPTPLLDWTFSPYVAAYFAYSRCDEAQSEPVRIFYIDYEEYTRIIPQIHTLASVTPHFSFLEAPSIANDRAIPQQGLLGLSNVADIERFVRNHEEKNEKSFLFAIDLPASEKTQVLAELGLMGITKATMFPGLDSICEELSNRYF